MVVVTILITCRSSRWAQSSLVERSSGLIGLWWCLGF